MTKVPERSAHTHPSIITEIVPLKITTSYQSFAQFMVSTTENDTFEKLLSPIYQ